MNGKPVGKMLTKLLPDFAWQTAFEILLMMEAHMLNEAEKAGDVRQAKDVTQNSVSVSLKNLTEKGIVERKMRLIKESVDRRGVKVVFYYRRVTDVSLNSPIIRG